MRTLGEVQFLVICIIKKTFRSDENRHSDPNFSISYSKDGRFLQFGPVPVLCQLSFLVRMVPRVDLWGPGVQKWWHKTGTGPNLGNRPFLRP